jgi:hypothetical protein
MKNLPTYDSYLVKESLDRSQIAEIKKHLVDRLRAVVEYTESSETFTLVGLKLTKESILKNILKEIDVTPTSIKIDKGDYSGNTEFKVK